MINLVKPKWYHYRVRFITHKTRLQVNALRWLVYERFKWNGYRIVCSLGYEAFEFHQQINDPGEYFKRHGVTSK